MACLVGLRSHSQLHWGRCLTRTGPKYVGSSVCTESLCMYVAYTNFLSIRFFDNTYDTVHIVLIKMGGLSEYHHKMDMSIHGPHR